MGRALRRTVLLIAAAAALAGALRMRELRSERPAERQPYSAPRLPNGQPDLQGVWNFATITPLERPWWRIGRTALDAATAQADEQAARAAHRAAGSDELDSFESVWFDAPGPGTDDRRTALITSPASGRLPPLARGAAHVRLSLSRDIAGTRPVRAASAGIGTDGYLDRGLAERCLRGHNSGPPIMPGAENQNIRILQTPTHAAILSEMVHEARIVPLGNRERAPQSIRQWSGSRHGWWSDETLIVESNGFRDDVAAFNPSVTEAIGTGGGLRLRETFRRVARHVLLYTFTVTNPDAFRGPFKVEIPMRRGSDMFEYACHEGNRAMENLLLAGRRREGFREPEAERTTAERPQQRNRRAGTGSERVSGP